MIEIRGVSKSFGENLVLQDFWLTIPDATMFGLVGINGAGKSTLLRLISGVYQPDVGEILIDGEDIRYSIEARRKVFFLPDDLYYTSAMNGETMAEYYRTFYNFDEEIFRHFASLYRLNTRVSLRSFSKGMKRQLFVSIAFACAPKIMLLDEAFDGLDPAAKILFRDGLLEIMQKSKGAAVIASHALRELEDICDSYGIIDGKKLMSSGSLRDTRQDVFKFSAVFPRAITRSDLPFECIMFETSGQIATIMARGNKEQILEQINRLQPIVVEELPVGFEQFFVSEVRAKGGNR